MHCPFLCSRYKMKDVFSLFIKRKKSLSNHLSFRCCSSLNLWNQELSTDIKIKIENRWRPVVQRKHEDLQKDKVYILPMFPYPSGKLHMGHVRVYTISDAVARFHRMNGRSTLHPIGWDAFGLPAENAALEKEQPPSKWTVDNIATMKGQLNQLACNFDWDREITTCQPNYYKWTQYLFLKMFEKDLIYNREACVNWDPVDKTVLADEQVDPNGCSWRSGAKVEKKILHQWFVKTTSFAKQLFDGLSDPMLEAWRDVVLIQRHWLGECNGIVIDFKISYENYSTSLRVWTDKPEKFMYGSFIGILPGSLLDRESFTEEVYNSFKKLKIVAHNPITGDNLPIFVTSQLPFAEGTDCYLGATKLSDDDNEFAKQFGMNPTSEDVQIVDVEKLRNKICNISREKGVGGYSVSSKLKDWLISRQRYWGTPIPIIHCKGCGTVPVPYAQLPINLPSTSTLPLSQQEEWMTTLCPQCNGPAKRETDTMDTFVDSSWYYLRYLDPGNENEPFDPNIVKTWMPVDLYIGGKEHAALHLYYARFMCHFLESIGLISNKEPFKRLLVQGMVMGKTYKLKSTGRYLAPSEITETSDEKAKTPQAIYNNTGECVEVGWEKMSKSKHNGVVPEDVIQEYGCDAMRLFMLADFIPTSERKWSSSTFPGVLNWQRKMWMSIGNLIKYRNNYSAVHNNLLKSSESFKKKEEYLKGQRNHYVSRTFYSFYHLQQYSAAISRLQSLTSELRKVTLEEVIYGKEYELSLAYLIIMLAPMAPHFACELWAGFQSASNRVNVDSKLIQWDKDVLQQRWPMLDTDYTLNLRCKVNGAELYCAKLSQMELNNLDEKQAFNIAMDQEKIRNRIRYGIKRNIFHLYQGCKAEINIIENPKPKTDSEAVSL